MSETGLVECMQTLGRLSDDLDRRKQIQCPDFLQFLSQRPAVEIREYDKDLARSQLSRIVYIRDILMIDRRGTPRFTE